MTREAIPTWFFAVTVVRDGERFLLVEEKKHRGWYLPAGRVEPGETLAEAAVRETLEESGVRVVLDGVLRVEHSPAPDAARVRAIFVAHPAPGSAPRPTEDSLDARFFTPSEMRTLDLRGPDVLAYVDHVAAGAPLLPLAAIAREHDPLA